MLACRLQLRAAALADRMSAHIPQMFLALVTLLEDQGWPRVPSVLRGLLRGSPGAPSAASQDDDANRPAVHVLRNPVESPNTHNEDWRMSAAGQPLGRSLRGTQIWADVAVLRPVASPTQPPPSSARVTLVTNRPMNRVHVSDTTHPGAGLHCSPEQAAFAGIGLPATGTQARSAPTLSGDSDAAHEAHPTKSWWKLPEACPLSPCSTSPNDSRGPVVGWFDLGTWASAFTHACDGSTVTNKRDGAMAPVGRVEGLGGRPCSPAAPRYKYRVRRTAKATVSASHPSQRSPSSGSGKSTPDHGAPAGPPWFPTELPSGPGSRRVRSVEKERHEVALRSGRYGTNRSELFCGHVERQPAVRSGKSAVRVGRYAVSRSALFGSRPGEQPSVQAMKYSVGRNGPFNNQSEQEAAPANLSNHVGTGKAPNRSSATLWVRWTLYLIHSLQSPIFLSCTSCHLCQKLSVILGVLLCNHAA